MMKNGTEYRPYLVETTSPRLHSKPLMAYRSNRRQPNPSTSKATKAAEAIGNWRANSPLWPDVEYSMLQ